MLVVEMIGRIRREHLVKGKAIKQIARDLKISRNTVRKVLRSEKTSFAFRASPMFERSRGAKGRFCSWWFVMRSRPTGISL